jgi:hypothetical protein
MSESVGAPEGADESLRRLEARVREEFRAFVFDPGFSCLGARAALRHDRHTIRAYPALGSAAATAGLARDLADFAPGAEDTEFTTFVAVFMGAAPEGEAEFEALLWAQLQALHEADAAPAWAPAASDRPEDPRFAFSFAGTAFFVVGMHPDSSRLARRFGWPALVFNARAQFDRLRTDGRYYGLRDRIRARELALQGALNPNLADFGEASEARQYSGRAAEPEWRCPFRSKSA